MWEENDPFDRPWPGAPPLTAPRGQGEKADRRTNEG